MPASANDISVSIERAVAHLETDGLVAFPTETVWGLGALARSRTAVERLQAFKGRRDEQPISLLIAGVQTLAELGFHAGPMARAVIDAFWPGPLTVILTGPETPPFAEGIAGPSGGVGFRCSDHPLCARLVQAASDRGLGPITATSFNRSGETPVGNRAEAIALAAAPGAVHVLCLECASEDALALPPSTVLDLSRETPQVLRWGAIGKADLDQVLDRFAGVGARR